MARTKNDTDVLTLNILNFLVQNPEDLATFLNTCGVTPAELRAEIQKPSFQAGMVDYFLENDKLLQGFLHTHDLSFQEFMDIRLSFPGAHKDFANKDLA